MTALNDRHRQRAEALRDRIRMSLALDEVMTGEFFRVAEVLAACGDREGAALVAAAGRRHRVVAIRQRAILSARGIDV